MEDEAAKARSWKVNEFGAPKHSLTQMTLGEIWFLPARSLSRLTSGCFISPLDFYWYTLGFICGPRMLPVRSVFEKHSQKMAGE